MENTKLFPMFIWDYFAKVNFAAWFYLCSCFSTELEYKLIKNYNFSWDRRNHFIYLLKILLTKKTNRIENKHLRRVNESARLIASVYTVVISFCFRSGGWFIGFFASFCYTFLWQEQPILFRFLFVGIDSACWKVNWKWNTNIAAFKTKLPVGEKDSSNSNVGVYLYANCFNICSVIGTPCKVSQIKLNLIPSIRHNYGRNFNKFVCSFGLNEHIEFLFAVNCYYIISIDSAAHDMFKKTLSILNRNLPMSTLIWVVFYLIRNT